LQKTLKELREKKWEKQNAYKGIPAAGAKLYKEDPDYFVTNGKTSVLALLNSRVTEDQAKWKLTLTPGPEAAGESLK